MDGSQKCDGWKKEARHRKKFILDNSNFMKFDYRPNYSMEMEISAVAASAGNGTRDGVWDGQGLTGRGL